MSLPTLSEKRGERPDTKTLVRLGLDLVEDTRSSEPPVAASSPSEPPAAPPSEPPADALADPLAEPDLVQLSFKGLRDSVRVRATREAEGLQLSAALPFLELDSLVGIAAPEDGAPPQQARIRSVRLEPGADSKVPRLSVELSFSDAPVDGELSIEAPAPQLTGPQPVALAPVPASAVERRTRPSFALALGLILGALFGAAVTLQVMSMWRTEEARSASPIARAATPPPLHLAAIAATPPPSAAPAPAPAVVPVTVTVPVIVPAEETAPDMPALAAEALPTETNEVVVPQVTVEADATHVLVPLRGDATGLRTYELSTPGLAVTLPHAQARGPIGNQRIVAGLVRRVWLLPAAPEGVQVRIITRRPATRSSVTFDEAGLHITLAH